MLSHEDYKAKQRKILERVYQYGILVAAGQSVNNKPVAEAAKALDALVLEVVGDNLTVMSHSNKPFIDGMNNTKEVIRSIVGGV